MKWFLRSVILGLLVMSASTCGPVDSEGKASAQLSNRPLLPSLRFLDRASADRDWLGQAPLMSLFSELGVVPGKRVLILGGGSGYLEYPLAKVVGEQGRIRSISDSALHAAVLADEARKQGWGWLVSEFRSRQEVLGAALEPASYDLCIWFDSYDLLLPEEGLLSFLRDSLKDGGQLAVITPRTNPLFSLDSGFSVHFVASVFRAMGDGFPVLGRLPKDLGDCLQASLVQGPAATESCLGQGFLGALNDLAGDHSLIRDLQRFVPWVQYYSEMGQRISLEEMVRLNWIMYRIPEVVDLSSEPGGQRSPEVEAANTTLLASLFAIDNPGSRVEDGTGAVGLECDSACVKAVLRGTMRFAKEAELFSDYHLLIFKKET